MNVHIVSAACRRDDGCIVSGPRHWDSTMWCQVLQITPEAFEQIQAAGRGEPSHWPTVQKWQHSEQGFIDQHGKFYTREEAWPIALANGQILQYELDSKWQTGSLHSEHLY